LKQLKAGYVAVSVALVSACGVEHTGSSTQHIEVPVKPASAQTDSGWFLAGDAPKYYAWKASTSEGGDTLELSSTEEHTGFGTAMRMVDATPYRGKRVRLSAIAGVEDVQGWAGLWMRVDGPAKGELLAFDNMQSRALRGTEAAALREVVLEVPQHARRIAFGLLLEGIGSAWASQLKWELAPESAMPTGFWAAGSHPDDYAMEHGPTEQGHRLALSSSVASPQGFGTLLQWVDATDLRGQRLRLSATVSGHGITGWAGLWMRVDGANDEVLAFDNMEDRPFRGDLSGTTATVELPVPPGAHRVYFGLLLSGAGSVEAFTRLERVAGQ
jgi:hypothetical protein